MNIKQLFAIFFIFACSCGAWFVLGTSLLVRTGERTSEFAGQIGDGWGPPLTQEHPVVWFRSPSAPDGKRFVSLAASEVNVELLSDPKKRGLIRYRTYDVYFRASYTLRNPTRISQTLYLEWKLPAEQATYLDLTASMDGRAFAGDVRKSGVILEAVILPPGGEAIFNATYRTRGLNQWAYRVESSGRKLEAFQLKMTTDFDEIDFPSGSASPSERTQTEKGWDLIWNFNDVFNAPLMAMSMPAVTNPGPVAARITFFAPVSLLFYFTALLMLQQILRTPLHPMHYFFLAAATFSFQLMFAYLVDLIPVFPAFAVGAVVSILLAWTYLLRVAGPRFAHTAALAQFAYMVLFSVTFFFEGWTGITITVGAVATLALLMQFTAAIDWRERFRKPEKIQGLPPEIPTSSMSR